MKQLDLNCWQFHIGMLRGALRELGAKAETMESLTWIEGQVEEEIVDAKLDGVLERSGLQKPSYENKFDSSGKPVAKLADYNPDFDDEQPVKKRKRKDDNGIAASEPSANRLGIPEWGANVGDDEEEEEETVTIQASNGRPPMSMTVDPKMEPAGAVKKRRVMSDEVRARIAEGQRARWAAKRGGNNA